MAVILGTKVPLLLRRKEGDDGKYLIIGELYVQGLMEGESVAMMSEGTLSAEPFHLVVNYPPGVSVPRAEYHEYNIRCFVARREQTIMEDLNPAIRGNVKSELSLPSPPPFLSI